MNGKVTLRFHVRLFVRGERERGGGERDKMKPKLKSQFSASYKSTNRKKTPKKLYQFLAQVNYETPIFRRRKVKQIDSENFSGFKLKIPNPVELFFSTNLLRRSVQITVH